MPHLPAASALREQFDRDGFVVLTDVFDPTVLAACNAAMDTHFGVNNRVAFAENFTPAACEVVPWNPVEQHVAAFEQLAADATLAAATAAVLGPDYVWQSSLAMYSPPRSIGQAWHQDCPCADAAQYNLNRLIYAHDVVPGSGEVVVVPGSHRTGEIPVGPPHGDLPGQRAFAPRANTLILLHGHTNHRVTAVGAAARISINLRVVPAGTPLAITDVGVYRNLKYRFSTREVVAQRT